jgi:ribosome-associated protein
MMNQQSHTIRVVEIEEEPIELYKILKFDNRVQSGGEAKFVIAEGLVQVNGEVETRKRKKLFSGDIVEFEEEQIRVIAKNSPESAQR